MKKSLLIMAAFAAFAANAETFDYGFNNFEAFPFIGEFTNPDSELYYPGNYDFVDKYGIALPNALLPMPILNTPEGADKGVLDLGIGISMLDGTIYKLTPDAVIFNEEEFEVEEMPEENWAFPILSWGEKGVTRTIYMPGWGSDDEWQDKDYNAAVEADWVPCKNGVQFTRLGTQGIVSRGDTYFQYPAVTGNVSVTVWAGTNTGGTANLDNVLEVLVTPVIDGVADPEQAVVLSQENPVTKRYYKLGPVTLDAAGKSVAFQVGPNNAQLNLMYVRIEGDAIGESGIDAIIADEAAADAPTYNVLGQRVNDSYKGLVIKGGKKFVQK